ncbi:MAG: hypothetical protein QY302_08640 [Anaerolineales bacterium]|jgi:hypothetical protein|nr:MAG: hypothetical protein QY302_08640 [Anaerolineales bacterium]
MTAKQLSMYMAPRVTKSTPVIDGTNWLDVSATAQSIGFTTQTGISVALRDALEPDDFEEDGDYEQRLYDALWLAHFNLSLDRVRSITFNFTFTREHSITGELNEVNLRLRVERQEQAAFLGLLQDF